LLEVSETEAGQLKQQAGQLSLEALGRMLEVLSEAEGRLRDAVSKKILLEVALLKAVQARTAIDLDTVLQRLHALRQTDQLAAPPAAAPSPAPAPAPSPASDAQAPAGQAQTTAAPEAAPASGPDLPALWSRLLDTLGRASPFTRSYLVKGAPVSFTGQTLVIGFDPEFAEYLPLIDVARNHALIQTKMKEMGFDAVQIRFVRVESSPASLPLLPPSAREAEATPDAASARPAAARPQPQTKPTPAKPAKLDPAEFKDDPLIKQALEVFKGSIAEVRG
jgi:DNA polymerase III gamma/tau subunit